MFYIGFRDEHRAHIGLACSENGIDNWQRHAENPIIFSTRGSWDENACYKPFAIFEQSANRWLLSYNDRKGSVEQIGVAFLKGGDLGF